MRGLIALFNLTSLGTSPTGTCLRSEPIPEGMSTELLEVQATSSRDDEQPTSGMQRPPNKFNQLTDFSKQKGAQRPHPLLGATSIAPRHVGTTLCTRSFPMDWEADRISQT